MFESRGSLAAVKNNFHPSPHIAMEIELVDKSSAHSSSHF